MESYTDIDLIIIRSGDSVHANENGLDTCRKLFGCIGTGGSGTDKDVGVKRCFVRIPTGSENFVSITF